MSEMLRRLREGELTSIELVEAHIARLEQINDRLNAIAYRHYEQARTAARAADLKFKNGQVDWNETPLLGLPFDVKNALDVKDIPTTAGAPSLKNKVAAQDSAIVAALKRAGAIPLTSSNLSVLAAAYETTNPVFGTTNNPYDLERTPGGSSGGSAALVASGGAPFSVGTDLGGSIRLPAAWCGVASLFLAPDRISTEGIQPPPGETDEWSIGPIARYVSDLALLAPLFQTATETKNGQPLAAIGSPTDVELSGLKVAYFTKWNHGRGIPDTEIQELVEAAAKQIETIGTQLQTGIPDSLHSLGDIWFASKANEEVCDLDEIRSHFQSYGVEKTPILVELMEWVSDWQGRYELAEQLTTAGRVPQLQQDFGDFMQEVDAIILPVHAYPAMKHGTTWQKRPGDEEIYSYLYFPNLCGTQFPAGTVRVGQTESGLPICVQIIGAAYREDVVLRLLQEIETKFGGWQPPPL